ncbi:unnamed protein product [Rotaria magnacalcarata]|uniref:Uncharacterized protein n=1 Tax=Rotaria magnacalcarata TaxID=392030 RepID=A0A816F9J6_9BILA|nr:unnamed protein product [Rotaria magnacalcarata]
MTEDIRLRHLTLFNRQRDLIYEWKKNQLRAVHQEAAHDAVLASLDDTSMMCSISCLPWHIAHVVRAISSSTTSISSKDKLFENRTFCHVFNNCLQNNTTVISILEDVLKRIKFAHPEVETAYIIRGNAGCYHDSETLLVVKALFDSTGIFIRRIDFSEPQEGVSKYNSIEFNLKRTLSSSKRTTTISTLSPLDIEITTWRAFTIGNAKTFQLSNFKSSVTNIVPLEFEDGALSIDNSWKSEESSTSMKRRKQIDNSRRFSNEPTATNTQQVNSNDTNDETDDDESSEYESHIAAQDMTDLQQTAKETLKK